MQLRKCVIVQCVNVNVQMCIRRQRRDCDGGDFAEIFGKSEKKLFVQVLKDFFLCFDYFEILGAGATSLYLSRGLRGETF